MLTCPHCQQRGVPAFAARFSDPSHPMTCRRCGRLSHRAAGEASSVVSILLLFATVMGGLMSGSWLLAFVGLTCVLAYNIWSGRRLELLPLLAQRADTAGKTTLAFDALWIIAWLWR